MRQFFGPDWEALRNGARAAPALEPDNADALALLSIVPDGGVHALELLPLPKGAAAEDGQLVLPQTPGLGIEFEEEALEPLAVE